MADPKGLLIRNGKYTFQARIPKKYHAHYPVVTIYEKLLTDSRSEAIRFVHERWASLHQEFARIDSTGNKSNTAITLEEMQHVVDKMVHSKIAEDGAMRSQGYHTDPNYKARALRKLSSDEQIVKDAISQGNYEGIQTPATAWLKGHGYQLSIGSPELRTFSELFAEGMALVNVAIRERDKGNIVFESKLPPPVVLTDTNSNQEETLESLRLYWLTQSVKSRTAKAEAITIINKFKLMVGDIKPKDITRNQVVQLKDKMLEDGLAPATINKGRGILAAIFSTALENGKIAVNPFSDMLKLKVPKGEVERPYNLEELKVIFDSPVFTLGERPKRFQGESVYWIPLLALYSGARMNELGQIYTEDVGIEDNTDFYMIKQDTPTGRTTKTGESRRVPIHPDLIKMGFLDYVDTMRADGNKQLFPELKVTRTDGKLADKWGDWWRGYVRRDLGIIRIPQPTHGFRHTFIAHCRRSRVDSEHMRIISGHKINTMDNAAYKTVGFPLEPLYEELQKLTFRGLDLSHLFKK